jgi:hypothetical protein
VRLRIQNSLGWQFNLHQAGEFRVMVQTVMDADIQEPFGTHEVAVNVGRQSTKGKAGRKDMPKDVKSGWITTASDIGTITISKPGLCKLSLKAIALDKKAHAGLTAYSVRLIPQ